MSETMHWVGEGVQPTSKMMTVMVMMVMLAEERAVFGMTMMKRGH